MLFDWNVMILTYLRVKNRHLQDIFTLFYLDRPFKFVSKTSNFLIPIVGWSMFLTGDAPSHACQTPLQMQRSSPAALQAMYAAAGR